ncbi:MAG: OB-fold nucleic acid binding domain-containing protein, partial [Acidimicrobiaceae bacterium]|nr:OB-fold nucleic acid binding domain-containing protein [Acidimicrobiaceae bacterium]
FLPRKLTKRGHRLVFSNGIIVLAFFSILLLLLTDARVDSLVAVYAIGVFTGFTMAGAGMSKHHLRLKERHWPLKLCINGFAAILSFAVVIIFAVTKFTQGAWAVVVLFPVMWYGLNRLHRRYEEEASVLGETAAEAAAEARPLPRSVALIFVDRLDLATARAIQYARTLSVNDLRAVHFVIDTAVADALQERWSRLGLSRLPLELADCPDRRVVRAALERADAELDGRTQVTVLLPRRSYQRAWSRFLHDAVGERIAGALSRLPNVSATIVPFDVDAELRERRLAETRAQHRSRLAAVESEILAVLGDDAQKTGESEPAHAADEDRDAIPVVPESEAEKEEDAIDRTVRGGVPGVTPIGQVRARQHVRVAGRVVSVTVQPWGSVPTLECELRDDTGQLIVAFLGRRQIAGVTPGARILVTGVVSDRRGRLVIINPDYDFLSKASAH